MKRAGKSPIPLSAHQLLVSWVMECGPDGCCPVAAASRDLAALIAADLAELRPDGSAQVTPAGRAFVARAKARSGAGEFDPFLAQHVEVGCTRVQHPGGAAEVAVDRGESPLAWLARHKGRAGRPLISPEQLQAGERLRAEFTRAQMTPRVTSNWGMPAAAGRGAAALAPADTAIAARQRVRRALTACGPEFAGLLLDVCCFLKHLDDVERERRWPPRSAKVVLQLGLDRLARHYGLGREARGPQTGGMRAWFAPEDALGGEA